MSQSVTEILQPLYIDNADSQHWDETCELLVVGFGAAGASTALEAHAQGVKVLIADRFTGGGASARSGGVIYAGGGTEQQKQAGFNDTPEAMFEYLKHETQGVVSDQTLMRFCQDSVANLKWLESHGAQYDFSVPPEGGKTSYPKDGYYLYYSGNELVPAYIGEHPPAPRGHRTVAKGQSGKVLFEHLKQAVNKAGIGQLLQSAIKRLVIDSRGQVVGAELWRLPKDSAAAREHAKLAAKAENWQNFLPDYCEKLREKFSLIERQQAKPYRVRATLGVALTTGGFIFNRQMMAQHGSKYLRNYKVGVTGCDGTAVRLGATIGAATGQLDKISGWRFLSPPLCWPKGIVVNKQGQRFCNEEVYGATLGAPLCEDHEGDGWLILDKRLRRQALWEILKGGYWWFQTVPALLLMLTAKKGKTLQELAQNAGMDAPTLSAAVARYNAAARGLAEDETGKSAYSRQVLDQGPFYACDISAGNQSYPMGGLTLGGLKVDEHSGAVLNEQQQPIQGLYAAGRACVGVASHLYVSGLSLADCVFSGRRIGQTLGALKKDQSGTA